MNEITIDAAVPVPPRASPWTKQVTTALRTLKPGESFLVPPHHAYDDTQQALQKVTSLIFSRARQYNIPITTRRVDGALRVWRRA